MPIKLSATKPPRGVLRWLLRMPIWSYRLHMGWLLGNRFLIASVLAKAVPCVQKAARRSRTNWRSRPMTSG